MTIVLPQHEREPQSIESHSDAISRLSYREGLGKQGRVRS